MMPTATECTIDIPGFPGPIHSSRGISMELESQLGRDHPVDLKRLSRAEGTASYEHLLTFVPVEIRAGQARICFLGRGDVNILREGARKAAPPATPGRESVRFSNLAMTLRPGDVVRIGPGLIDLTLQAVARGRIKIRVAMRAEGLLLNMEPLEALQELNLRNIVDRLDRGEDYRIHAL